MYHLCESWMAARTRQEFWNWLFNDAKESQDRLRSLAVTFTGIVIFGLTALGTTFLPGLGTLAGLGVGVIFGAIICSQIRFEISDRLSQLTNEEVAILVNAMQQKYVHLSFDLAHNSLWNGVIADLLDQLDDRRKYIQLLHQFGAQN